MNMQMRLFPYFLTGKKNMQQWWFDDVLGLESVIYGVFTISPLFLRFLLIFMNMQIS